MKIKNPLKGMSLNKYQEYIKKIENNPIPHDGFSQCQNCNHILECEKSDKEIKINSDGWLLCYLDRN
jgi:hypothetical protein